MRSLTDYGGLGSAMVMGAVVAPYALRVVKGLRQAVQDHEREPCSRPTWLFLEKALLDEVGMILTNTPKDLIRGDYWAHNPPYVSDRRVARLALTQTSELVRASGFGTTLAFLLAGMAVLTPMSYFGDGIISAMADIWLTIAIADLGHHIANPKLVPSVRRLVTRLARLLGTLWLAVNTFGPSSPLLSFLLAVLMVSALAETGRTGVEWLSYRKKGAAFTARSSLARRLRHLFEVGPFVIMPAHLMIVFGGSEAIATRLGVAAFILLNVVGLLVRYHDARPDDEWRSATAE